MEEKELLPHLFRTEYRKLVAVLCYLFGIEHVEIAEDIASDTFLAAAETWAIKGVPENPAAWLYTVAKNRTKNHLKRNALFEQKVASEIRYSSDKEAEIEIDMSPRNITDSQLAMIFAVCNPLIPADSQVALALNLLCGFGVQEIADAFLLNKEVVYKRIQRAKEKLKEGEISIAAPSATEITDRLETVLTTIYLLYSEGYYSISQNTTLRKELCAEAIRLNFLLMESELTDRPEVSALLSLMCFHSSRFEARTNQNGEMVLYEDQDESLWNRELIERGTYYLSRASTGDKLSRYHLEAGIAYWHTHKEDSPEKWESILDLYNHLLAIEYSPVAALNRIYALAKVHGKEAGIAEAERLNLTNNHFYYSLLGNLYAGIDKAQAVAHYETAIKLAHSESDKAILFRNIARLQDNAG
ncbi:RNA polymerase sigma-70 factor (ECF subfamily) [Dyadobacter sp. BE34]|uniref:RNA polymerase sigma-70 factor (ECF subfamily) n=1 Tax=Dyadobacter fermentans TaxID=94254 RepID=A0ABU1R528_9BACT|nr:MULTISPECIES: sigma-70 family RNA polymerase sigma factor [Dyadobacter]MDR6808519.1 RNA polymerase sigma-70 factor (ECF subfamily) [Dyadobacter fermentans]MDR7046262.1 RNA polymerase sigma-70 factor (ECF subfamily) [Dyadobacter sp. BE242]MDR7200575.1 RNA polymerase sigma-70 factor (ECF subfamily) [Dyadobacter sp. BE34]MDR7218535.1 RNA polymerase sigma-70 factor (ECF subfamily) [Dyadobacter sp. BE31]MDR7266465.1 RNA polymerase sigma-70 factor (ECF subfamily) [Dyadobacter sp. BE32]